MSRFPQRGLLNGRFYLLRHHVEMLKRLFLLCPTAATVTGFLPTPSSWPRKVLVLEGMTGSDSIIQLWLHDLPRQTN